MEEENNSRMMANVSYYLKENELTRPFLDLRLFIITGGFFILDVLPGGGEDTAIRFILFPLFFELFVLCFGIMYKRIHTVIENQKEILRKLDERKRS